MATPAEKKALLFLGVVTLFGAATRLLRPFDDKRTTGRQAALGQPPGRTGNPTSRSPASNSKTRTTTQSTPKRTTPKTTKKKTLSPDSPPIDLDVASTTDLEALGVLKPGIARMIVANRDSFGPFGSIQALSRIPHLRKTTITTLAPFVTFSRVPRPSNAVIPVRPDTPISAPKQQRTRRSPTSR